MQERTMGNEKKNILITDDRDVTHKILKSLICEIYPPEKINFYHAKNGNEALTIITTTDLDLVLLDWIMEEKEGIDVLKEVKRNYNGKYNSLPIIMVTSNNTKYDLLEATDNGAYYYIVKPILGKSAQKLKDVIKDIFKI
jgi:CheY-like chemotaxis protein